jgi:hypothetical protein
VLTLLRFALALTRLRAAFGRSGGEVVDRETRPASLMAVAESVDGARMIGTAASSNSVLLVAPLARRAHRAAKVT